MVKTAMTWVLNQRGFAKTANADFRRRRMAAYLIESCPFHVVTFYRDKGLPHDEVTFSRAV
jgi:hypothetical protein